MNLNTKSYRTCSIVQFDIRVQYWREHGMEIA